MKRFSGLLAIVASLAIVGATVALAGSATLKTFGTGLVTITGPASATIVNDPGEYGGVYIQSKSQSGKLLNKVVFQFESRGDVGGGAPRFSLPIDDPATTNVPSNLDGYAFLDAAGCGATVGPSAGNWLVSTQNPACHVNYQSVDYANWTAFAAANPTLRTAPGYIPFIIADVAGSYIVTDIALR